MDGGRVVVVPVDIVDKTAGSAVFLTSNRAQFGERAANAPEYEKKQFGKADLKALLGNAGKLAEKTPRRTVAEAGKDFVETPAASLLGRLDKKGA